MKKSLLYIWVLPLLIISIAAVGVNAQSTTIGVEPVSIIDPGLVPGEAFTVEIWIRDVQDLAGPEFKLGYDTTVLTATLIEYGGIFGDTYFPLISKINDTEGWLHYGFMEAFGEPPFSGDGRVAIITFSVDSEGESVLDLYDTLLGDSSPIPQRIPHEALPGFFSNVAVHDIAVTNATPYPTEVDVGDSVAINVTVTNEGNFSETFTVTVYADIIAYGYDYDPTLGLIDTWPEVKDEITVGTQTVTDLASGATTTVALTWDTTGVEESNYTISAEASAVTGETDTTDNLFVPLPLDVPRGPSLPDPPPHFAPYAFSPVSVVVTALPGHDIAVTSVTASPTEVDVGDSVAINVTVTNEGDFSETFTVTVYYDGTEIESQTETLANGTSTTLSFTWDTTGVAEGTYTISAEASVVSGETDTADNTKDDGTVTVEEAAPAPDILIYAVVAAVAIVIVAAAVIYFVRFRR